MSTVTTRSKASTSQLAKPMSCAHCKAPHFEYQLTCRRCGKYFGEQVQSENAFKVQLIVILSAVACVTYFACKALGVA